MPETLSSEAARKLLQTKFPPREAREQIHDSILLAAFERIDRIEAQVSLMAKIILERVLPAVDSDAGETSEGAVSVGGGAAVAASPVKDETPFPAGVSPSVAAPAPSAPTPSVPAPSVVAAGPVVPNVSGTGSTNVQPIPGKGGSKNGSKTIGA